jgi:hypothetical protein
LFPVDLCACEIKSKTIDLQNYDFSLIIILFQKHIQPNILHVDYSVEFAQILKIVGVGCKPKHSLTAEIQLDLRRIQLQICKKYAAIVSLRLSNKQWVTANFSSTVGKIQH